MKRLLRLLGFGMIALCSPLYAASNIVAESSIEFTRLDLIDGRRLANVLVKSYDPKTDRVVLVTQRGAMSVPLSLIPVPARAEIKKAPIPGNTVNLIPGPASQPATPSSPVAPIAPPSPMQTTSQPTAAVVRQPVPAAAAAALPVPAVTFKMPPPPPRPVEPAVTMPTQRASRPRMQSMQTATPPEPASTTAPAENLDAHKAAALRRAENYYRYEHVAGSNNIRVLRIDFEASEPEPVPGWGTRHRTEGKAFLEYYDSAGGALQRTTSLFEVLTERKSGSSIQIVQFNRKS